MLLVENKNIPYNEYVSKKELDSLIRYINQVTVKDKQTSLNRINKLVMQKVKL